MSCNETYNVRVTLAPKPTVLIFTVGTSSVPPKVVKTLTVGSGKTFCFKEDPQSTVHGLVLGVDECGACNRPGDWQSGAFPEGLSVAFTAPGGELLLKATTGGNVTYTARDNPPNVEGGRPIIRHELNYYFFWIVFGLIAAAVIGYFFLKRNRSAVMP